MEYIVELDFPISFISFLLNYRLRDDRETGVYLCVRVCASMRENADRLIVAIANGLISSTVSSIYTHRSKLETKFPFYRLSREILLRRKSCSNNAARF